MKDYEVNVTFTFTGKVRIKAHSVTDATLNVMNGVGMTLAKLEYTAESIDCKEGCWYCCTLSPDTIPQEVDYVLGDIPKERLRTDKQLCPLLHEGKCRVYERKPIMCRTWHSLDVSRCRLAYETKDGGITVPAIGIVTVIGGAILEGLTEGIYMATEEVPRSVKLWRQSS